MIHYNHQSIINWVLLLLSITYIIVQIVTLFVSNIVDTTTTVTTTNNKGDDGSSNNNKNNKKNNNNIQSVLLKEQFIGVTTKAIRKTRKKSSSSSQTQIQKQQQQQQQNDTNNNNKKKNDDKNNVLIEKVIQGEDITTTSANSQQTKQKEQQQQPQQQNNDNQQQQQNKKNTNTTTNHNNPTTPDYYIVYSTSCNDQQHWESWVFFYHCWRVHQPGIITRIVSGCTDKERIQLQEFHTNYILPSFGPNYKIHFTPDFSRVALDHGYAYKYMNKPYGLKDWFQNGPFSLKDYKSMDDIPSKIADSIVFLLDPDMILLRPIVHDYTNEEVQFIYDNDRPLRTKIVKHGYPMSQQDGYLHNEWMRLNHTHIFPNKTVEEIRQLLPTDPNDGPVYWNTGPPYIGTVHDMYQIAMVWSELAPRVVESKPELFSEMYGYILATVQLGFKHSLLKSLVISETTSYTREGWDYIDRLPDNNELCTIAINATTNMNVQLGDGSEHTKLPIALHYCSRYILRKKFFSKYRIKKNIMNCEKNLLEPVTKVDGLYPANDYYTINPPKADKNSLQTYKEQKNKGIAAKVAKREVFMLCAMSQALNIALRYLKINTTYCTGKPATIINLNESYTVYTDPTNH